MQVIKKIIILLLLNNYSSFGQTPLLKVVQNQKYGYIDTTGKIIVPCNFHTLAQFSEGLAAARSNGLYGYIDTKGSFVIEPQFEYATHFSGGYAQVFHEGTSFFIDKKGETTITSRGERMGAFEFGVARVRSNAGKTGLINRQGHFVVDTNQFSTISSFDQGVAIVTKYDPQARYNVRYKYGLIDTTGKFVLPFDRYREIKGFENGFAKVLFKNKVGLIDRSGRLLMKIPDANFYIEGFKWIDRIGVQMKRKAGKGSSFYHAYANQQGKLVINNPAFEEGFPFSNHRAFVEKNDYWILIDPLGNQVSQAEFYSVLDGVYRNGCTWVKEKAKRNWSIIDLRGVLVCETKFEQVESIPNSDLVLYGDVEKETWGLAAANGEILTPAVFQEYNPAGFEHGVLLVAEDGYQKYIDTAGKCIWMAKVESNACGLNIDYMLSGHCYASSERHLGDSSGFAQYGQAPQAIQTPQDFPADLAISIKENQQSTEPCKQQLYVSNRSGKNQFFNAQDSRLYLKLQAKDVDGQWKDIEYLPSSWCGNSYHLLTLPNETYWSFPIPSFEGSFSTMLRAELRVIDSIHVAEPVITKKDYPIYSNEFQGKINPAQFWRKEEYSSAGIMDPYHE